MKNSNSNQRDNMRIFWTLVYFCLVASFINVNAAEVTCNSTTVNCSLHSNCITVTFDQIHITKDGMFVHLDQEFLPIYALYSYEDDQYKCDIHNRLEDLTTCSYCGLIYDRYQYRVCPNQNCSSRRPGPKH